MSQIYYVVLRNATRNEYARLIVTLPACSIDCPVQAEELAMESFGNHWAVFSSRRLIPEINGVIEL